MGKEGVRPEFLVCTNSSAHELDGIPGRMLHHDGAPFSDLFVLRLRIKVLLMATSRVTCVGCAEVRPELV